MNQNQRTFLITAIEKQYKKEQQELHKRKPKAPNLSNYLTAAILDGSFELTDPKVLRDTIRKRVISLGQEEALLDHKPSRHSMRGREEEDDKRYFSVPADLLFVLPDAYKAELEKYNEALAAWVAEEEALTNSMEAMRIKVQLGSDKALAELIDQADQLCAMSLTSATKLIGTNAPKQLK